jgi:hypothetical protein
MIRPAFRTTLLAAALAATAASAWATYQSSLIPAPQGTVEPLTTTRVEPADVESTLDANETVVIVEAPAATSAPIVTRARETAVMPVAEPVREAAIEVTRPRLTLDQRIQADVIDLLARNPHISGLIGVESAGAVVTLTGYTATSGQAQRAGRHARGVEGVREVQNLIRPRVGGSA